MSVHEFYLAFKEHGTLALTAIAILMTIVQITPIKVNPWSALCTAVARAFSKDLSAQLKDLGKKITEVDTKLDKHISDSEQKEILEKRVLILDFANEIAEGNRQFTKEKFRNIMSACDEYTAYCETTHFKNSVAEESIALIRETYADKLKNNSFLRTKGETV